MKSPPGVSLTMLDGTTHTICTPMGKPIRLRFRPRLWAMTDLHWQVETLLTWC
jgi:hypothetical protein